MGGYSSSKSSGVSTTASTGYQLQQGETAFVRATPTWINPDGEIIITSDEQGRYRMAGRNYSYDGRVDETSDTYKNELRSDNVKASFKSDGTVEVANGGLFSRKKKFKNVDAFQSEVNKKLDAKINYYNASSESIEKGFLPYGQLAAENYANLIKSRTLSDATKQIRKDMEGYIKTNKTKSAAAQDMKERLSKLVDDYRKR